MSERTAAHASFAIERTYAASPARVFAAWATPEAKSRWNSCHDDWGPAEFEMDFRVGGREASRMAAPGGPVIVVETRYQDIVPGQRIVYTYDMLVDDARISVSLATVEFEAVGGGTRLRMTEHSVFLDGYSDAAGREAGTLSGLERLDAELQRELATV